MSGIFYDYLYVTLFVVSFGRVFLAAFQQQNVSGYNWMRIFPTSLGRACMEFVIYGMAAVAFMDPNVNALIAILATGSGAGLGCLAAMKFYLKIKSNRSTVSV